MSRKSWLDLRWPVAGVDRSVSYQSQPPYTTPDALNVRTEGTSEYRERGGSRPGLDLAIRTQLPGPIRLLTKVSVLKNTLAREVYPYIGTQLRDSFQNGNNSNFLAPTYNSGPSGGQIGSFINGPTWGRGIPVIAGTETTLPYEISLHVRPKIGQQLEGEVSIHFGLSDPNDDILDDSNNAKIRFNDGTYTAELREYDSGVAGAVNRSGVNNAAIFYNSTDTWTATAHTLVDGDRVILSNSGGYLPAGYDAETTYHVISATANTFQLSLTSGGSVVSGTNDGVGTHTATKVFTDNPNVGGVFTVRVVPNTKQVKLFYRNRELIDVTVANLYGQEVSFDVVSADTSIETTQISYDFGKDPATLVSKNPRRDLLVAVSEGQIWLEDTVNTLAMVPTSLSLRSDVELTAVDREQKLYIADFGSIRRGEAASVGFPNFNTVTVSESLTGVDSNFALEIIDSDYSHNQRQEVTVIGDGGNYNLLLDSQKTANLAHNANASAIQSALEALSNIGAGNVVVTGAGPFTVEFQGTLAGTDQSKMTADVTNLTHTTATPSVTIAITRSAADGKYIAGSYQIIVVAGFTIGFDPAITVAEEKTGADITGVEYRIVRTPKVFDPKELTLTTHRGTTGIAPAGCRLVALYRDRIVYAGSDVNPHIWYMSRQGDPDDWDYTQEDSGAAIFAQSSTAGQLAEPITALIAHGDECLIIGAYNSLWIIRGDPGFGGTLDQLSRKVGIVGPHAWCRTPDDMCIFLSADGLYVMAAGCAGFPVSLSRERLPDELLCLTPEREVVSLEFDSHARGVHIMVTRLDSSEPAHWWFDWEAKSFWRVGLQRTHDPFSQHERVVWDNCPIVLQGGRDGYIRYFNRDVEVDDGDNEISSYCLIGPFHLDRQGFMEGVLTELQGTIGENSGPVTWSVKAGGSSEKATNAADRESGDWNDPSLNYNSRPRVRGVSACVKLANKSGSKRAWFIERVIATVLSAGRKRVH